MTNVMMKNFLNQKIIKNLNLIILLFDDIIIMNLKSDLRFYSWRVCIIMFLELSILIDIWSSFRVLSELSPWVITRWIKKIMLTNLIISKTNLNTLFSPELLTSSPQKSRFWLYNMAGDTLITSLTAWSLTKQNDCKLRGAKPTQQIATRDQIEQHPSQRDFSSSISHIYW